MVGWKRASTMMATLSVATFGSLLGHAGTASAQTALLCADALDFWTFSPPLTPFIPPAGGSWTLGDDRACAGVVVTGSAISVVHDNGLVSGGDSGTYGGLAVGTCLIASMSDGPLTGVLIGGQVALLTSSGPSVFYHVMAPLIPCMESSAIGVGGGVIVSG